MGHGIEAVTVCAGEFKQKPLPRYSCPESHGVGDNLEMEYQREEIFLKAGKWYFSRKQLLLSS